MNLNEVIKIMIPSVGRVYKCYLKVKRLPRSTGPESSLSLPCQSGKGDSAISSKAVVLFLLFKCLIVELIGLWSERHPPYILFVLVMTVSAE